MSRIRVERITDKQGTGAPLFPNGIRVVGLTSLSNVVSGIVTASQLFGDGSNLTGVTATDVGTLSSLNVTGNVSIGGTLTYEDVTNVDSVGLITARSGVVDSTLTSGRILIAGASGRLTDNNNLKFDGSRLDIDSSAQNVLQINSTNSDGPSVPFQRSGSALAYLGSAAAAISGGTATDFSIRSEQNLVFASGGGSERLRIGTAGQLGLSGANYGTSGQVLTSQGASAAPQWASAASVTVRDAWWSTSNSNNFFWNESTWGGNGSTLARRTGFPTVSGQQVTHSSGVWTFPSTGLWQMEWHFRVSSGANNLLSFSAYQSTNSGSSYDGGAALNQSQWFANWVGNYSSDNMSGVFCTFGNITNASTYRMKFVAMGQSGQSYTIQKSTWCMFTKLA